MAQTLRERGVWKAEAEAELHRLSPAPFALSAEETAFIGELGWAVWSFYKALNALYLRKGNDWVKDWLDQGKPSWLTDLSRMHFSKHHLPRLLRPDLILGEDQMWVTELDSVPGGAGDTAIMSAFYADHGLDVIGGGSGIPEAFARVISDVAEKDDWTLAIVVSDESESYRQEMGSLAEALRRAGYSAWCVHPRDVRFDEEGLSIQAEDENDWRRIEVLWRFYELFDLRNIPKSELIAYAAKKRKTLISPPYKPFLEEKLALALLHHAGLAEFWQQEMGEHFHLLRRVVPRTWVMDPAPVPRHASIEGLTFRGKPVRDFLTLSDASQKERRLVVKPSGFSPRAWGSRGVVVGHDVSQEEWAQALRSALEEYPQTPHILQEFHEGRRLKVGYFDPASGREGNMHGRARLSPYYYVVNDEPVLAGVLATVCPDNKKLIHGMSEAVMTVCA
ncbi:MAG: hypothetical protein IT209_10305 [Armatimonadetes bacterium]|nr:hypothetical protein [Armatimonadota bacterium]